MTPLAGLHTIAVIITLAAGLAVKYCIKVKNIHAT